MQATKRLQIQISNYGTMVQKIWDSLTIIRPHIAPQLQCASTAIVPNWAMLSDQNIAKNVTISRVKTYWGVTMAILHCMEGTQPGGQLKRKSEYEGAMKYEVVHECHFYFVLLLPCLCFSKVCLLGKSRRSTRPAKRSRGLMTVVVSSFLQQYTDLALYALYLYL